MAIIHAESFAKYNAAADLGTNNIGWISTSSALLSSGSGRFGERTYDPGAFLSTVPLSLPWNSADSSIIIGAAFKYLTHDSPNSDFWPILTMTTVAGSQTAANLHWDLCVGSSSQFILRDEAQQAAKILSNAFYNRTWHWLEVKISMLDAGSYEIRIDGVTVASGSGDFRAGTGNTSSLAFLNIGAAQDRVRWSDLIVMDSTGGDFNDFKGDMRFENQLPDADGAVTQWTASAGSNFQTIDDALPLASASFDTDYISHATDDEVNLASHADHVLTNAAVIHFAKLSALSRNDGSKNVALRVVSDGTGDDSSDFTLNTTYRWCNKIWETDPDTGAAWALSAINAAEWGVKLRP